MELASVVIDSRSSYLFLPMPSETRSRMRRISCQDQFREVFEQMNNIHRQTNLHGGANAAQPLSTVPDDENRPLTEAEL